MRASLAAVAVACLFGGTRLSCAQNTATKSEISAHDAPTTFKTGVNLVTVPVVVRDPAGKAIGTLTQEDFQLFDKGKPQIISKFSIEKSIHTTNAIVSSSASDGAGAAAKVTAQPFRRISFRRRAFGVW